jgi:endonuclease-3 related protein
LRWQTLEQRFAQPTDNLREELLKLNGGGTETAASILLYAGNHPIFVVDTYSRRVLARQEVLPEKADYEEIQEFFQRALAPFVQGT